MASLESAARALPLEVVGPEGMPSPPPGTLGDTRTRVSQQSSGAKDALKNARVTSSIHRQTFGWWNVYYAFAETLAEAASRGKHVQTTWRSAGLVLRQVHRALEGERHKPMMKML